MKTTLGFWRTTILGGAVFLLPLAVVLFLVGQVLAIVYGPIVGFMEDYPELTATSYLVAIVVSVVLLLLACFAAGLVARWSLGRKLTKTIESKLLLIFPRYAIIKDVMADSLGEKSIRPNMKPVQVRFSEWTRVGFEMERSLAGQVTVYLPGSPDPWMGEVLLVDAAQVSPITATFGEAVAVSENLGRGAGEAMRPPVRER